jgi:hypothetical protein
VPPPPPAAAGGGVGQHPAGLEAGSGENTVPPR